MKINRLVLIFTFAFLFSPTPGFADTGFEKLVEQVKAANGGKIQNKFEDFQQFLIGKLGYIVEDITNPDSRSRQKNRHTAVVKTQWGDVFIGYSEGKGELEGLSDELSEKPTEPSFQIIKDFNKAKFEVTRGSGCLECHQHGGPIMPRQSWREFDASFARKGFDQATKDYNALIQARQVCQKVCGSDLWCREALLTLALTAPADGRPLEIGDPLIAKARRDYRTSPDDTGAGYEKEFAEGVEKKSTTFVGLGRVLGKNWNKDSFGYACATLPDRDRDAHTGFMLKGKMHNGEDMTYSDDVPVDLELGKYEVSKPYTDIKDTFLDPRTDRPLTRKISSGDGERFLKAAAFPCMNLSNEGELGKRDSDILSKLNRTQVATLMKTPELQAFIKNWSYGKGDLMAAVKKALNRPHKRSEGILKENEPQNAPPDMETHDL